MEDCPCCGELVDPDDAMDIEHRLDNDEAMCPACGRMFGDIREDI